MRRRAAFERDCPVSGPIAGLGSGSFAGPVPGGIAAPRPAVFARTTRQSRRAAGGFGLFCWSGGSHTRRLPALATPPSLTLGQPRIVVGGRRRLQPGVTRRGAPFRILRTRADLRAIALALAPLVGVKGEGVTSYLRLLPMSPRIIMVTHTISPARNCG
ncbi:MAG: hypothetical protein CMP81_10560 [Fulvimarina sp.]|nr:hypothetical protein [Fulvimarina sp.]